MRNNGRPPSQARGEGAGFLVSLAFTALASVRDVYFGGVFQSTSPLGVAVVAFTLCSVLFLPIALVSVRFVGAIVLAVGLGWWSGPVPGGMGGPRLGPPFNRSLSVP